MLGMVGCATGREMTRVPIGFSQTGEASWYGKDFHGRATASGEPYDMWAHTAAHRTLPFHAKVRVTLLATGASTVVRINDRGPFVKNRIIDLSLAAARDLGLDRTGTGRVRIEVIGDDGIYLLQLGSFKNRANAETLRDRVRGIGYRAELQQAGGITLLRLALLGATLVAVMAAVPSLNPVTERVDPPLLRMLSALMDAISGADDDHKKRPG